MCNNTNILTGLVFFLLSVQSAYIQCCFINFEIIFSFVVRYYVRHLGEREGTNVLRNHHSRWQHLFLCAAVFQQLALIRVTR